eukprot:1012481_1
MPNACIYRIQFWVMHDPLIGAQVPGLVVRKSDVGCMKFIHDLSVYNAYFVLEIQSTFCCFSDRINCQTNALVLIYIIPSTKCNDSCICCLNPQFDSRIPQRKRSIIGINLIVYLSQSMHSLNSFSFSPFCSDTIRVFEIQSSNSTQILRILYCVACGSTPCTNNDVQMEKKKKK